MPLVGLIIGASGVLTLDLPWVAAFLVSTVLANAYVALMFFGHEVAHGAMVRSVRLQNAVLWLSCAVFLVSPHLWRHWHNRLHHGHTNVPAIDPDRYDLLHDLQRQPAIVRWLTTRLAPGSGHWLSVLYPFVAFTVHGQLVLWLYSWRLQGRGFRWTRALTETALIAMLWLVVSVWMGGASALMVVVVPMLLANAIVMAYVTTNHMLRPLTDAPSSLTTTTSVTTLRVIDVVHLHFSHHVEHHLFPAMSHRYYPLVRQSLRRIAGDRYLAPAHWRALLAIYRTPRHYAAYDQLINPLTGHRVALATVEARLRCEGRRRRSKHEVVHTPR